MEGVGPGTTLDGRYTTQRRIEQREGYERWSADDTTLGRPVTILCLPESDHRASAVLDSARRAAGVENPTLLRVLDVGRERAIAYVVEADTAGMRSLAQLVHEGGLPADEVRRIVGEVGTGLEAARQRGLHHLDLRPEDVLRSLDGEVRLRGVATAAALAGRDDLESEVAARRDAVGVVSLAYAGLTGLWPGPGDTSLGDAPEVLGRVAAPSEIAAGVPRDLDALCRLTLGDDQGPTSPGDFARQIAPWPSRQVAGRSTIAVSPSNAGAVDPRTAVLRPPVSREPVDPPALPTPPAPADPAARSAPATSGAVREADHDSAAPSGSQPVAGPGEPTAPGSQLGHTAELAPVAPDSSSGSTPTQGLDARGPGGPAGATAAGATGVGASGASGASSATDTAAAAASAAGAALAGAGSAVAGAMGRMGSRMGDFGRAVGERASERAAERRGFHERITAPNAPGLTPDGERLRPGTGSDTLLEAPAPLVPSEPLTKDESKLALGIVAGFLVLALVIGLWGVSRIGANTKNPFEAGPTHPIGASTSTGKPTGSAKPTPSGTGAAPTGESLQILGADGFDPEGDGRENGTRAPRVFDGDKSTSWQSEGYSSASLGGLKKGVGVTVDLGPNVTAREVTLTLGNAADVSLYIGPDKSLKDATKVGEKAGADGTVTFPVKEGVTGQYIIVWFTGLTQDDNGRYRAILSEVEAKN